MDKEAVSKAVVRRTMLIVITIFIIGLVYVGYRGDKANEKTEKLVDDVKTNQERIIKITEELKVVIKDQCLESQHAAQGINDVFDILIDGAKESLVFSPTEKAARIKRYESAKTKNPVCAK